MVDELIFQIQIIGVTYVYSMIYQDKHYNDSMRE
jgi:hypothetical protein